LRRRHLRATASLLAGLVLAGAPGCVTVRAQQRAALADPVMQFDCERRSEALRLRAIDSRQGSSTASEPPGGGDGCK
jgi:hypothetical protein